mgnify:FL=1
MEIGRYLAGALVLLILGIAFLTVQTNSAEIKIVFEVFGGLLILAAFVTIIRMIREIWW